MKGFVLLMSIFLAQQSWGSVKQLSFHGTDKKYVLVLEPKVLKFFENSNSKEIMINKCNKKLVNNFWLKVTKKSRSFQPRTIAQTFAKKTWINFENKKKHILPYDPEFRFFYNLNYKINVLSAESYRLCSKKW